MQLNNLLIEKGVDPATTLVMRHRPTEPELNRVLPWLAAEKPSAFNAYQQCQNAKVEKVMLRASHLVSLVRHDGGRALFIGIYRVTAGQPLTYDEYWNVPENLELKKFGMKGFTGDRPLIQWFDLTLLEHFAGWKGKLILRWPPPDRSWWRWADRNEMLVDAILEDSLLDEAMPDWREITLSWDQLSVLPTKWRNALTHWRGIYFIFDSSDDKGYVGSAYGSENILGRWVNYAASGHGGNVRLRKRSPKSFRFSILERVSPDLEAEEVIRLENTWKDRLHTRTHGLNDN